MVHPNQKIFFNEKYLDWIRDQPCLVCGADSPSDAHHVWATGKKNHPNDFLAVPLCREHHTFGPKSYHRMGHDSFEEKWTLDLKNEIINLLAEYLDEFFEKL